MRYEYDSWNRMKSYPDSSAIQHLHYLPFGEEQIDQRLTSFNSRYTFSAKEKDVETNYSYFGARYYNSDLSIWLSVDPMSDKYPSLSPYNYCNNNPIILIDPNGMWDVEINATTNQVNYTAQEGDDLSSLSKQLGVSMNDLKDYEGTSFEAGQFYSFDKLDVVKDINAALGSMNSSDYNCSNLAFGANGIIQDPAFGNGNDGVDAMSQAASLLSANFSNVSEGSSRVGDIVTFGYSEEAMRREAPHQNTADLYSPGYTDRPSHYGIVLLKSKDGNSVSKVLEKPGSGSVRINSYSNYQIRSFTPRPQTGGITPFYRRK